MTLNKIPCIMNYSSRVGFDRKNSYEFWYYSDLIRVIGDKQFSRGDVVVLDKSTINSKVFNVEVLGDPNIEPTVTESLKLLDPDYNLSQIPTLLFLTTKIPLDLESDYNFYHSISNDMLLLVKSSEKNLSKCYTIATLVKGNECVIKGIDSTTNVEVEWVINSSDYKSNHRKISKSSNNKV